MNSNASLPPSPHEHNTYRILGPAQQVSIKAVIETAGGGAIVALARGKA
jgi:hypothetical protein